MSDWIQRERRLEGTYATIRRQVEQRVKRWEWYSGSMHRPEPHYYLRSYEFVNFFTDVRQIEPGTRLPGPPARVKGKFRYGFDAAGNVLVAREHTTSSPSDRKTFLEEFFFHRVRKGSGTVDGVTYNAARMKNVLNVSRQTWEKGRLTSFELFGDMLTKETYDYDGSGRVVRIHTSLRPPRGGRTLTSSKIDVTYKPDGQVHRIIERRRGQPPALLYQARRTVKTKPKRKRS